jgi:hypothetical protein
LILLVVLQEAQTMSVARIGVVALVLALSACASPREPGFHGQRTVFSNPYVPPVIDEGTIGPHCDEVRIRRSVCTSGAIIYPGRGSRALLPDGQIVRLTRAERRFLRDRADALQAQRDVAQALANGTPLPPGSPALPPEFRGGGSSSAPSPSPPPATSNGKGGGGGGREARVPD